MPYIDPGRETSQIEIWVGGALMNDYAVWSRCTFDISAAAQPGTCNIVCKDPYDSLSFTPGWLIQLKINGDLMWQGYLMAVEQGYFFPDKAVRMWTLRGVDLNILLDKLVMYNHANPALYPDGGGVLQKDEDGVVYVPQNTLDADYIKTMFADFDLLTGPDGIALRPTLYWDTTIESIGQINPDGKFTPPAAGTTLRAFLEDVARSVERFAPGSAVFYISPGGEICYRSQDLFNAPFSVTDSPTGAPDDVPVRELTISTDISRIKNDVLVFATKTDPQPGAEQEYLNYRHNTIAKSIRRYGRFQYTETVPGWTIAWLQARSTKLLWQEGEPALSIDFVTYRHGLYPGQIINVFASHHNMWVTDAPLIPGHNEPPVQDNWREEPFQENVPIRAIGIQFASPTAVRYRVTCSYDTQDPWGLLLALKKPAQRGFVQPVFQPFDGTQYAVGSAPPLPFWTYVTEYPVHRGGNVYQCRYGYIRNSIAVYRDDGSGGLRLNSLNAIQDETATFQEIDPDNGKFLLGFTATGSTRIYVTYHKSYDLTTVGG